MTVQLLTRRSLVIAGAVAALVIGAASIRVAAAWTAASSPLNDPPASLTSLQASLDGERGRSDALDEQLRVLESASADLAAALDSAQGQVAADTESAEQLRASLAGAKQKLARLEATLADAARTRAATTITVTGGMEDGAGGAVGGGEDHADEPHETEEPHGTEEPHDD
jgi:DNA repair exonuclease SbcCD ATPase subunit